MTDFRMSHGHPSPEDAIHLATRRADGLEIWQTDKTDMLDPPEWPRGPRGAVFYRGIAAANVPTVMTNGIDVPPKAAFFLTDSRAYAWEHPMGSAPRALLLYDRQHLRRSFVREPNPRPADWTVDKTLYPSEYIDPHTDTRVHTRFGDRHYFPGLAAESLYGYWSPADPNDALLGVIVGGPIELVTDLLAPFDLDWHTRQTS
ncbi:hypothetical protein [Williamsia herbipolensis]|uniref:hypothetical protein n=1 Tax=Williamsia herbipolensis TaxID=1603258 RepID=UPI0005F7DCEB|nr:hypothetical protein [Williamsia herbipolensis]